MMCQRCRGLLVRDAFYDLSVKADTRYATTRCINCGHVEDAVVRANRIRISVSTQATPRETLQTADIERITVHPDEPASIR